jgi:hypothetical protein
MIPEQKRKIAKVLSAAVTAAGVIVIAGWIFNIDILKSLSPAWNSMKFDTAVAFVLSGVTLYFIIRAAEGGFDEAQVVLAITCLIIFILMGTMFFTTVFGIHTGVEELFMKDTDGSPKSVVPGRASIPTMINFMLVATAGIFTMLHPEKSRSQVRIIGLILGLVGATAVVGYLAGFPPLYYYVEGINSAIAFNTAVLFILLGTGFLCL